MSVSSVISIRDQGALDLVRSLLKQGISVRIRVSGSSMRPLLSGGEIIEVAPPAARSPKIGEILLFYDQQGNPLVHRLIRRRCCNKVLYLQTKGDACAGCDGFIPAGQVLGRVQRIIIKHNTIDLQHPVMHFRSFFIALRSLILYYYLQFCNRLSSASD
ncbi:MAG: S24/S26 family peptidase [Candidatus Electrothrix sp. YB6]